MSRNPRVAFVNKWSRKLHRWGAVLIALPLLVIIGSGLLLQVKKQVPWVQPPEQRGGGGNPTVTFDQILQALRATPQAAVSTWADVDRLDVRPGKGMLKVRCRNEWEVQIDTVTGGVLQVAFRRSDLIESIHDGSFFHPAAKLWVFLPTGAVLLGLWATGTYLWVLPLWAKRRGRRRRESMVREAR